MNHLDDLAGLDVHIDRAQRKTDDAPRWAIVRDWPIVARLRALLAGRAQANGDATGREASHPCPIT